MDADPAASEMEVDPASPKRGLSPAGNDAQPDAKRQRLAEEGDEGNTTRESVGHSVVEKVEEEDVPAAVQSLAPTKHGQSRQALQRSIAMVLRHDGFAAATPEAMESFTEMVQTYLETIIEETKRFAVSSRRDHPIPPDFEAVLRLHNLPVSTLKPHLKNPLPSQQVAPQFVDSVPMDEDALTTLPLLGEELSGQPDKDGKPYIPASFPDFPSRHTYRFTFQEDTGTRDSKKIREEAARAAQQGEEALRRLVRASKMRKQKEVKSLVERDTQGKERFRLWEQTMRRFMVVDGRGEGADQVEIADHSMIVNGDARFSRKEVSRLGKRSSTLAGTGT